MRAARVPADRRQISGKVSSTNRATFAASTSANCQFGRLRVTRPGVTKGRTFGFQLTQAPERPNFGIAYREQVLALHCRPLHKNVRDRLHLEMMNERVFGTVRRTDRQN